MGHHDDPDRGREAEEILEHKHPARPEQTDESYATGAGHASGTPEEEREPDAARRAHHGRYSTGEEQFTELPEEEIEPNFARGLTETDPHEHGRFSTGEEQLPDSPEKEIERRFSEGIERSPTSE